MDVALKSYLRELDRCHVTGGNCASHDRCCGGDYQFHFPQYSGTYDGDDIDDLYAFIPTRYRRLVRVHPNDVVPARPNFCP
jgi:hypothetical protein